MTTIKKIRYLPVNSLFALELIQREMNKLGIGYSKVIDRDYIMLITLDKPYPLGAEGMEFDRVIFRRTIIKPRIWEILKK